LQTRDFAGSTCERKIPVNFLLFTGKPGFAPSKVVPVSGARPPQRVPLHLNHAHGSRRHRELVMRGQRQHGRLGVSLTS
jgi:hypothetical protein